MDRERQEIVRYDDDLVRVERIGRREAERPAGGRPRAPVRVPEGVRRRRRDEGDVDVKVAVLNRAGAPAVRAEHARLLHSAERARAADRAVHRALDMRDDAALDVPDERLVHGEERGGREDEVLEPARGEPVGDRVHEEVPVPQVMVK